MIVRKWDAVSRVTINTRCTRVCVTIGVAPQRLLWRVAVLFGCLLKSVMSQIFFFCTLYDGNATFVYK